LACVATLDEVERFERVVQDGPLELDSLCRKW
jgi:hypothetical protein